MRVEVSPQRASVVPGQPVILSVSVFNTTNVISGYRVRVLGVDEHWVTVVGGDLSLFPDTGGTAIVSVTLPAGIPAGPRRLTVEVRELTPPARTQVVDVDLVVPAELRLKLVLDPVSATAGRSANFGVVVECSGNAPLDVQLAGADEEGHLGFTFAPAALALQPGDRVTARATLSGRRPLAGSPKIRQFTVRAEGADGPVEAFGSFVQRPLLSRGALALVGLVAAVTVFAVVITATFGRVVHRSDSDRDLALQVVRGSQAGATTGSGSIGGQVTQLTAGTGVPGVTVSLFSGGNTAKPVATTATDALGAYKLPNLPDGTYKLDFRGAGFTEVWFPQSLDADGAKEVQLAPGQDLTGINVRLGGIPASIAGTVTGTEPAGAVVSLLVPGATPGLATIGSPTSGGTAAAQGGAGAVVQTATVDAAGTFTLTGVPSPSTYDLVVTKTGYATEVQRVDLGGGENRTGIVLQLRQGDGSISGHIASLNGPLGGATIRASDGHTTVETVSLTRDDVGAFTLDNLPTPATLTVLVSQPGFATQTLTLTLSAAQHLTGVNVTLISGSGSIAGHVTLVDGSKAGGVTVKMTNGDLTVQAVTLSVGDVGSFHIDGLAIPSTYTVTFSRSDLASQTRSVDLDGITTRDVTNVDASLQSATASMFGTVKEKQTDKALGEIDITLTSGTSSYSVKSATVPNLGAYELSNIAPGTYSLSFNRKGAKATSAIVTLTAGQRRQFDPVLDVAASIFGKVLRQVGSGTSSPLPAAEVRLFLASQYPNVRLSSVLTDGNGDYVFDNLDAPQNYIVEFAYPQGTPGQETVSRTTESSKATEANPPPLAAG